jgi:PAS domain S-box-containing protein
VSAHQPSTSPPDELRPARWRAAGADDEAMQQFNDDIERLTYLPARWQGLDPTAIVGSVLDTLVDMLDLDFVGLRFSDTVHIFLRSGKVFAAAHDTDVILHALDDWLAHHPERGPARLAVGADLLSVVAVAMGDIASMGLLVAGSRRAAFPQRLEALRLKFAAVQTSLACREVRELNNHGAPVDTRAEKPTGAALAESELRLNLIIDTIPAMAWSATADGILDFCNRRFEDFVGLRSDEILGLGFYRIFHPDDLPHLLSAWQEIMASKRSREIDGRIRRADGEYRWFTLRQNPLLDPHGSVVKWYGVVLDIEDRKRAEEALEVARSAVLASERNLRLIIDSLPVLAWVARADGSAEFVNRRWAEYAGVAAEQILEWGFLDFYHPDDVPAMVATWKLCLESRDRMELKGRIRRFDGEYRWFLFAGQKITNANGVVRWVGANVDFEDLQRAEDALKASEKRLTLIIDTIPAMAWSATAEGHVDFFNKNLLDYCGLRVEDVTGDGFYRMFHPDDLEPMRRIWERVKETRRVEEVDARVLGADGKYRWFNFRQSPLLDASGALVKWYGVLMEIEDRKRAEEKLRQSQSELARVTRLTTLGELAVSIAHEVNQPLMAIVTNAGTCLRWLDEKQFDADRARLAAERVVRDGHRAGEIVAGIRALARKAPSRLAPMDLHEAIRDVLLMLNGEFLRWNFDTSLEAGPEPLLVLGDRTQLQQVLLNLMVNSIEAMTEDHGAGGRLTVRTTVGDDGFARVSVLDTGPGLDRENMERIFEAFFSTKSGGIGMGLSICRSIIESHGGSITATHHAPRGSIFTFTVPLTEGVAL